MSRVEVVAFGAVSGLGEGPDAVRAGEVGKPAPVAIRRDSELAEAGLLRPFAARAPISPAVARDRDHEATLLLRALRGCVTQLDRARLAWREDRVGLVLGTSSGGMRAADGAFASLARGDALSDLEAPTYFGTLALAARTLGLTLDPCALVLGACASSALAIGLAARWLERGDCDLVLAGGFDDVTVFVAAGFEALRATTASPPPRPFRAGRDGMSLGEGAAVLALARAAGARAGAGYIAGFSAASDAVHLTAPDRQGVGLARAARAALEESGIAAVDLVGAHATATPFNDAAEAKAIARALGEERARETVVHPFKAQIGHTLGAAGALETLACLDAMRRGVLPAAAGEGAPDPEAPARMLARGAVGEPRAALKLSSAFGGANAALVLTAQPPLRARPFRSAYLGPAVHVAEEPPVDALAAQARTSPDRIARADRLVRFALAAVASLEEKTGRLGAGVPGSARQPSVGIIVGTALATLETNARFAERLRARGPLGVEPRVFPYTSPNAVAGECSIAFGLTGPGFAVGGGMHAGVEALVLAALLVAAGDADRVVVVAADDAGPVARALAGDTVRPGAVGVLVTAEAGAARARIGETTLRRGPAAGALGAAGHLALLPLVRRVLPRALEATTPPDAYARVELIAL